LPLLRKNLAADDTITVSAKVEPHTRVMITVSFVEYVTVVVRSHSYSHSVVQQRVMYTEKIATTSSAKGVLFDKLRFTYHSKANVRGVLVVQMSSVHGQSMRKIAIVLSAAGGKRRPTRT